MSETLIPEQALSALRQALKRDDAWFKEIVESRDAVLSRFQPIFAPEHLPQLTAEEFRSFLPFSNNHHWPLQRQGTKMCVDMSRLRSGLSVLVDESRPIEKRMSAPTVPGMGRGVMTAVLLVAHPDKYGVWNNTSEQALKSLGLWPDFASGEPFGSRYVRLSAVLRDLAQALNVDLWTLDAACYSHVVAGPPVGDGEALGEAPDGEAVHSVTPTAQSFGLERHLHEFLRDNWDRTSLGVEWTLYGDPGADEPGYEYPCAVGSIDLLAKHRTKPSWLVVELKRGQGSDQTVGQVLRYMGWVKQHLAEASDQVRGLVIAHESDTNLRYALLTVPDVDLMLYEVQFSLREHPRLGESGAK